MHTKRVARRRAEFPEQPRQPGSDARPVSARSADRAVVVRALAGSERIAESASQNALSWPAVLFLVSLIIPWIIELGSLRLSVSRLILIAAIIPCLVMWMNGKAGRIRAPDILVILFCLWCSLSLAAVHDLATSVQSGGMMAIETMGAYFLARVCVRNERQFYGMVKAIFLLILLLLPFSIYESVTGSNIALNSFRAVLPTQIDYAMAPRWGLRRVQSVFDHPILYGVFCTIVFALVHKVLGRNLSLIRRWGRSALVFVATLLSMSSGPLSALVIQALLMSWGWILRDFRYRWHVLAGGFAALYLGISLLSNQSFFEFYVHYFAFSQDTGWDRIRIWHYGWLSIFNHPIFGIGFHEYQRPEWMEPSIDMFWLINFVRFGYPGGILMFLAFAWVFFTTALKEGLTAQQNDYRTAYLISMIGIFTVGWTVHFWNAPYLLIMFYLGSASWMQDIRGGEGQRIQAGSKRTGRTVRTPS